MYPAIKGKDEFSLEWWISDYSLLVAWFMGVKAFSSFGRPSGLRDGCRVHASREEGTN